MAASMSQLTFIVFIFCGGFLTFSPCHADHPGHCTLDDVKNCTGDLLTYLKPVFNCSQAVSTCLDDLGDCDEVTPMKSVFDYLCDDDTGVLDALAVYMCFADEIKEYNLTQAGIACAVTSMWNDGLEGQARCNAATTFATCIKTPAENLCSVDRAATFYDKTEQLLKSYGCFGVEVNTAMSKGKAAMMTPNLGMMAVILGLSLMTLQRK